MKNSHVHGILHVSEITRSNDKLILSCGELNGYKFAENEKVPFVMLPLIFISTVITHGLGGSAGREGAALQLGGSIGYKVGKIARLKHSDMHIIVMSGMAAVFSALFGALEGIRIPDLPLRRRTLYPAELLGRVRYIFYPKKISLSRNYGNIFSQH